MKQQHLLGEVARGFQQPPHKISYLYSSGRLAEPKLRLGNKRIFTCDDIRRLEMLYDKKWIAPENA